jgi:hypothetical protein
MAIKRTHIYRGHAIVHHVFATDETHEKIEQFIVSKPGKSDRLASALSLEEAQASVDDILTPGERYVMTSA